MEKDVKNIIFFPSYKCNLNCKHCFYSEYLNFDSELSSKTIISSLEEIKKNFPEVIVGFSGGEFTMYKDWKKVLEETIKMGYKVGIVSNGLNITEEDIELFKNPDIRLAISVDGFKDTHNEIRGDNTYEKVISKLEILKENFIDFDLNTLVTKKSLYELEDFINYILQKFPSITNVNIQNIIPFGKAKEADQLLLDKENLENLFYKVQLLREKHISTNFNHFLKQKELLIEHPCKVYACTGNNCHTNKSNFPSTINVFPDGEIIPLWSLVDKKFSLGNINENNIITILEDYKDSENHQFFLEFIRSTFDSKLKTSENKIIDWASIIIEASKK